jgi:peptide deformylase
VTVLPITTVGDPVLRRRAAEVAPDELASAEFQAFIDDLVETKRAANGAGLAANQVGDVRRIAVVEVEAGNPRYPYKPPFPLTIMVNPELEAIGDETFDVSEGCLSVPDLRGTLRRHAKVRARFLDRHGEQRELVVRGLSAGTFQHEVDHLDGVLFLDRVTDPTTLTTWEQFERFGRAEFEAHARRIVERFGA